MSDLSPTYVFEDGTAYAIHEGKVIAQGADLEQVQQEAEQKLQVKADLAKEAQLEKSKRTATHIVTPNGLRGEILGRMQGTWGEEVTCRFENGQIRSFRVSGTEKWESGTTKTANSSNPIDELQKRMDAPFSGDKESLLARAKELKDIRRQASTMIRTGSSFSDEQRLHEIVVTAEAEGHEVAEALEHLEDADRQAFEPPSFEPQVVEQETVGVKNDGTWLDHTVQHMIDEAEATDFDKLLAEGPVLFTAELPDGALADAGSTREMALSFVRSKTAGVESDAIADYERLFIEAVESARRTELASRADKTRKEAVAKKQDDDNLPDEAFFI